MSRPIGSFRTGTKQVATAGTAVQLTDVAESATGPITVMVQALGTNTGGVVVGDSNVVAAAGTQSSPTQRGILLAANDIVSFDVGDISAIWVDALNNNDGVSWMVGAA